jgi:D-glycero-D-manno-heptose 1,7-bisphosphate phosphatase
VINRAFVRDGRPYPPSSVAELELLPGVLEALERLKAAHYRLIVVTNQPDVARGTTPRLIVDQINARLMAALPLDAIRTCYHDSSAGCECRKPRPGLLLDAANEFNIDLGASWMVGDRWRDVEAGSAAGCRTIFLDYRYSETQPVNADFRVGTLLEAAAIILREQT